MKTTHDICAHHPWHLIADWAAMVRAYFAALFGAPDLGGETGVQIAPENIPHLAYAYEWQGKRRGRQLVLTTPAFAPHISTLRNNRGVAISEEMRCPRWTLENRWRRVLAKFQNYARNISSVLGLPDGRELRPCAGVDPPFPPSSLPAAGTMGGMAKDYNFTPPVTPCGAGRAAFAYVCA